MHICTYMQAQAPGLDNDKSCVTVRLTVKVLKYMCIREFVYLHSWRELTYIGKEYKQLLRDERWQIQRETTIPSSTPRGKLR